MSDKIDISDYFLACYVSLARELQRLEWQFFKYFHGDETSTKEQVEAVRQERKVARDRMLVFRGPALEQGIALGERALEMRCLLDEIICRCEALPDWLRVGKTREEHWHALTRLQSELWVALEPMSDLLRAVAVHVEAANPDRQKDAPEPERVETQTPISAAALERLAKAVGDDNAARIMAIANRRDWSAERKMEEILRLDNRFAGKDSQDWATLLGVSNAAIRKTAIWKQLRRAQAVG